MQGSGWGVGKTRFGSPVKKPCFVLHARKERLGVPQSFPTDALLENAVMPHSAFSEKARILYSKENRQTFTTCHCLRQTVTSFPNSLGPRDHWKLGGWLDNFGDPVCGHPLMFHVLNFHTQWWFFRINTLYGSVWLIGCRSCYLHHLHWFLFPSTSMKWARTRW